VQLAPGIPCALCLSRDIILQNLGCIAPRERGLLSDRLFEIESTPSSSSRRDDPRVRNHSSRLFTFRTQARTSASTSGSTALTSATVMPALMRGSYSTFMMYWS
jgi:hypothetical protein